MRHRLRLEAPQRVADGGGGAEIVWQPVAELWAEIAPASPRDTVRAEKISAEVSHRIALRHRDDVTAAMRFRADDRVFDIVAHYDPDERRRRLVCLVRERLTP
ncbi:phage head closure protein [Kaustia mangrovi]|uniref:Phage head closure protein n=2 Tax=Kaustia mangrovi TaxID=2593653 RepID=A0A7S8C855_9HYPH|nr:phage head closure protein [Kaustia mangrovi]